MSQAAGKLAGKVAIITGASSGIGAATAVLFSRLGANLALAGRNTDNLKRTAELCLESGASQPILVQAELNDEKQTKYGILAMIFSPVCEC